MANATRGPGYQSVEFGIPYHMVVDGIRLASEEVRVPIAGFSDLSIDQIAADCQLSLPMARLAKLREYSEPFRILHSGQSAQSRLFEAAHRRKLRCFTRGRYRLRDRRRRPSRECLGPSSSCIARPVRKLRRQPSLMAWATWPFYAKWTSQSSCTTRRWTPRACCGRVLTAHLTSASGAEG